MSLNERKTERRRWRAFRSQHRQAFLESGLPLAICESREIFDDFLMHGYLDHHEDPRRFTVDELSPPQVQALKRLIVAYLSQDFADPGLGIFSPQEHSRIRAQAGVAA